MDPNFPSNPRDNIGKAKALVHDYVRNRLEKTDTHIEFTKDDVYIVSYTLILGGWKAVVSTTLPDGMYYEVTHDIYKKQTYVDAYKKFDNVCYSDEFARTLV